MIDILASEPALKDAHLLIVGDGPAREPLEARARAAGVAGRVTITGVVGREDLPRYISAFDVALQPEVTEYASPLKLFEYMAMRRAIVAPATENIREVLENGIDALLFQRGDMAAFQQAILQLASDDGLRARLGEGAAAKITAREMTWRGNAKRAADMIVSLRRSN
jgi:glycosyltransferase involved in cell wall biosynthesis